MCIFWLHSHACSVQVRCYGFFCASLRLDGLVCWTVSLAMCSHPMYILIVMCCLFRRIVIYSTAFGGAYACVRALSFFTGHFPNDLDYRSITSGSLSTVPWQVMEQMGAFGDAYLSTWCFESSARPSYCAAHSRLRYSLTEVEWSCWLCVVFYYRSM